MTPPLPATRGRIQIDPNPPNHLDEHGPLPSSNLGGPCLRVSNAPLREAFLASPLTAADIARHLGWWDGTAPDASRVRRTLGIANDQSVYKGQTSRRVRRRIDIDKAEQIADVLNVPRWELEEEAA